MHLPPLTNRFPTLPLSHTYSSHDCSPKRHEWSCIVWTSVDQWEQGSLCNGGILTYLALWLLNYGKGFGIAWQSICGRPSYASAFLPDYCGVL